LSPLVLLPRLTTEFTWNISGVPLVVGGLGDGDGVPR